jgi:hypothetical protein
LETHPSLAQVKSIVNNAIVKTWPSGGVADAGDLKSYNNHLRQIENRDFNSKKAVWDWVKSG